jgi:BASS family bile acid:Na+ symporter
MDDSGGRVASFSHFLPRYFLWFLIGSYVAAGVFSAPGLWVRGVSFGTVHLFGEDTPITLPLVMLALLLVNAGLGVRVSRVAGLVHRPLPLAAGLAGNLLVPIAYIFGANLLMRAWHNPDEVQNILVGLALADHPRVLLPIIFYNLVQHLVAGFVDFALFRKAP